MANSGASKAKGEALSVLEASPFAEPPYRRRRCASGVYASGSGGLRL